jgi:hypothetical protein
MRRFVFAMWVLGCTTTSAPPPPTGKADDGSFYPSSKTDLASVPWRAAWRVDDGVVVPGAQPSGFVVDLKGVRAAEPAGVCGQAPKFAGKGLIWLPSGEASEFTPPAMVTAPIVERASWRVAEVLGPPEGVLPGVESKDPTLFQGIRVRAVHKLRWAGPPWQVVVGERKGRVGIAVSDPGVNRLVSGVVLNRTTDAPVEIWVTTGADLDGDGVADLVVGGDGPEGAFRAVVSVVGFEGEAVLRSFEEQPVLRCR